MQLHTGGPARLLGRVAIAVAGGQAVTGLALASGEGDGGEGCP